MTNPISGFIEKLPPKEIQKLSGLLQAISNKERKKYPYAPLLELPNHFKISWGSLRIVFYQKENHTKIQNISYTK